MKYFSTGQRKIVRDEQWTQVSWDKGSFPAEVFKMMMGQIYGSLGKDCKYIAAEKKFFVKVKSLGELNDIVKMWDEDFTPNTDEELDAELQSAFED